MAEYEGSIAYNIVKNRWGIGTTYITRSVTVSPTGNRLLGANPRRVLALVANWSTEDIQLSFNVEQVSDQTMTLQALGSALVLSVEEDGELVAAPIYAWSEYGDIVVGVTEVYAI